MIERHVTLERWPLARPFRTARVTRTHTTVVTLTLRSGDDVGCSEHVPYERYGEDPRRVAALLRAAPLEALTRPLETTPRITTPATLHARLAPALAALPRGAARGALADAFLDLLCKRRGLRVWELLGLPRPRPVRTLQSLGADVPERMADDARRHAHRPVLKLKASGDPDLDLARVRAVHEAAPRARLLVDANESWTPEVYLRLVPRLAELGVAWLEQPFPASADHALRTLPRPLPVCADESAHDARDLGALADRYDAVNLKLGKTSGLLGALVAVDAARRARLRVMVGCMVSTSLALAPALLVAQHAELVDLDGASFLARDRVGADGDREARRIFPASFWG